ncbi:MAG: hypothetical protein ACI8TP_000984 [Acidimicrobiales bacterium]|jgi:hypothetical protein
MPTKLMIRDGRSVWHCELASGHRYCATTLENARRIARTTLEMDENEPLDLDMELCPETSLAIGLVASNEAADAAAAAGSLPFCVDDIVELTGHSASEIRSLFATKSHPGKR